MNRKLTALTLLFFSLIGISIGKVSATVFNVMSYGATGNGTTDDTAAIQATINAAIAAGSGNEVYLPAGTYLEASGPLQIENSTNLTFSGAGTASTFIWYTRTSYKGFLIWYNTNFTMENLSADVEKMSNGNYDVNETQGTITAINTAAKQITVQSEAGYPLFSASYIEGAPTGSDSYQTNNLYTLADPTRYDFTDGGTMTAITPTGSGSTATITLTGIPSVMYVGEQFMVWGEAGGGGLWLDSGYTNYGTFTLQNIDYYGGACNWMGNNSCTGTVTFNNLYCGPPPYQPDRMLTCDQAWQMGGRGAFNVSNSTFIKSWDDVFDRGNGETVVISQQAANQILISGTGDYELNDSVELCNDKTQPTGTYGQSTITAVSTSSGNTLLTLSQNVTVKNPDVDYIDDLSQAGAITATNDVFNSCAGRHVYFRGISVSVSGCTFLDGTPFLPCGWDGGEAPSDIHNLTVTNNTFQNNGGIVITGNGGGYTAPCSTNITITGNKFVDVGHIGQNGGDDVLYGEDEPITCNNATGVNISNNWFEDNWGANTILNYDANATISGNLYDRPNQQHPTWASKTPDDMSVIWMSNVTGGTISGNVVNGAGPYTRTVNEFASGVSGVNGQTDGTLDVDNPLAFYMNYDQLVADRPSSGVDLDQAAWTGGANQKWTAIPAFSSLGYFTLNDSGNGQFVGNGTSKTAGANVVEENQALSSGNPTPDQLWNFAYIDANDNNIIDQYSGYALNVIGSYSSPGTDLCQWYSGSATNQNWYVVTPPAAKATEQAGTVNISWTPVPYAVSYSVGRSTTSGGPYTTLVSGLPAGGYIDTSGATGTTYYYVITAAGLPVSNGQSNQVEATPNGSFMPVDLTAVYNVDGIENDSWNYAGPGLDSYGYAYSAKLTGTTVNWNSALFNIGSAGKLNSISDAGQRIILPNGLFTNLLIIGSYLGSGPGSTGTFQPTLTYSDGSQVVLSQGMTNWCGSASQPGESNAATFSYRDDDNGTTQSVTNYFHGYSIPITSTKSPAWLTLSNTGNFRIQAIDLSGENLSALTPGQYLLPGQYIDSPNAKYYLVQQTNGDLMLYNGSGPASRGALVWSSGYTGASGSVYTTIQTDGNLVTYLGTPSAPGTAEWSSGTYGNVITALQLTNTPELQIVNGSTVIWQKP